MAPFPHRVWRQPTDGEKAEMIRCRHGPCGGGIFLASQSDSSVPSMVCGGRAGMGHMADRWSRGPGRSLGSWEGEGIVAKPADLFLG